MINTFKAGETFKFLAVWNGSFVRLSRIGDNAKLTVEPSRIGYAFESDLAPVAVVKSTYVRPDYSHWDSAHTDDSGPSREIVTSTCLAGKYSGQTTIHLTPSEEREYNRGMAEMAQWG